MDQPSQQLTLPFLHEVPLPPTESILCRPVARDRTRFLGLLFRAATAPYNPQHCLYTSL